MANRQIDRLVYLAEGGSGLAPDLRRDVEPVDLAARGGVPELTTRTGDEVSFGPFSLSVSKRLLTREGAPVALGGRSFDLLAALVSRPGEIVSKRDLLSKVWPDVTVEEGNLRFHIATLRRLVGDGKNGARYIASVPGRGYAFVAPISRNGKGDAAPAAALPGTNLPSPLVRMVGRADDLLAVTNQLSAQRFVTIVGAGGVGKTTVAVAVAHELMESFKGAVLFVDLGALRDPNLVAASIASMAGLSVQSDDVIPSLIAHLRDRRLLLILDTCEHLVETVAALSTRIFAAAPHVHILATSREALRVEGEHVFNLAPLACPPNDPGLTAAVLQSFPAIQLFMQRAASSGARLEVSDADAAIMTSICRKLGGVPLAIELAAGRVEAYGLEQTAALLDHRLTLVGLGRRTAPPRQKTLQATLEWSYALLTEAERVVLRQLAVFVGPFTLEAALEVVRSPLIEQQLVFGAIDSLVAKSMVATNQVKAKTLYRLLDTTRIYAHDIKGDDDDLVDLSLRHAAYYRRWLEKAAEEWSALPHSWDREANFAGLNNTRAALEWCFGPDGNVEMGVGLAAAAVPIFSALLLLPECCRWSTRALLAIDDAMRGGREEMQLQAALGMSLMFTRGNSDAVRVALERALAIAEELGDADVQMQMLGRLHMFHHRVGNFKIALGYAERSQAVARGIHDPRAMALVHSLCGISLSHGADLAGARKELEAALRDETTSSCTRTIYVGFNYHNLAGAYLARTLWLQGYPLRALDCAKHTVEAAERMEHPTSLSFALIWLILVLLYSGDLDDAERRIELLISHADSHALAPYLAIGRGLKGGLAVQRGDAETGVEDLRNCLEELHAARFELLTAPFNILLAQGLAKMGRGQEGMMLIDETIRLVERDGNMSCMPELLRVKGGLHLTSPRSDHAAAETCFRQSLEMSRRQGARAWELRTATDLATLLANRGQCQDARALLQPIFDWFAEGRDTADLKVAAHLLASLH